MAEITIPMFTESDVKFLEAFTKEELQEYIDFFRDYKEFMWLNNDTGEIVSDSKLGKMKVHCQPSPQYPEKLLAIGRKCREIDVGGLDLLTEEGFFNKDSLAKLFPCTLFTPTLICAFFADAYHRSRFFDGLLGFGVKDGIYLKMVLHLQDCHSIYHYYKSN